MEPEKCLEWRWIKWDHIKRAALNQAKDCNATENNSDMILFTPIVNFVVNGYTPALQIAE
jgi:hypothetical protein